MDIPLQHSCIARLTLSGTDVNVGSHDSGTASPPSVWFQTEDNPEIVYIKVAEAKLLIASLAAAISDIEEGD